MRLRRAAFPSNETFVINFALSRGKVWSGGNVCFSASHLARSKFVTAVESNANYSGGAANAFLRARRGAIVAITVSSAVSSRETSE